MTTRKFLVLFAMMFFVASCASDDKKGPSTQGDTKTMKRPSPKSSWADFTDKNKNGYADRVFFGYDQYDLSEGARKTIQAWADWVKAHPGAEIRVEGHCDERGTREYNLGLGAKRAHAVRNYLIALGVQPRRLKTVSYGKERPAVAGANEEAWAKNRRGVAKPKETGS